MAALLELNPELDVAALAGEFAARDRLQVRDVLTDGSAAAVRRLLAEATPWGLAWQAGGAAAARLLRAEQLGALPEAERKAIVERAATNPDYGFAYHSYPLVTAYLERWHPGSPHERLLEELNSDAVLQFMRQVTGIGESVKMDGQATLYAPGDFLRLHSDAESEKGRRVAYVLNLTMGEWPPHWGGYLNFYDEALDVEQAFRPRFNSLNLFRVPQWHSVGEVSASAPLARYAITGWARDR
jgi:Rps23 Pro-64 3,4-dihydroxylase Tpa1-like proline 4-hydroxylase